MAERSHLSARAISDLERGVRSKPYQPTVDALAKALGLTAEEAERFAATVRRGRFANRTS